MSKEGVNPLNESFSVKNIFAGNVWNVNFTDNKSKNGKLDISKPISMVEYMVDLNPSEKESPMVNLYKEWRFKYKVNNTTGIFQKGFARDNEYLLVLQGKGNLCTASDDFKNYRFEVTGKKSDFMFFGSINTAKKSNLKLNALKGDYSGCSCGVQTNAEMNKSGKWKTFNFYADLGDNDQEGYFNLDGKDVKFPVKSKGKIAEKAKIGDKITDVYEKDGTEISIESTFTELPCDGCEGMDFDVTITVKRGNETITKKGRGSCGC